MKPDLRVVPPIGDAELGETEPEGIEMSLPPEPPRAVFNDASLVEQARAFLQDDYVDAAVDYDHFHIGFRVHLAQALVDIEQANQLKRIADNLVALVELQRRQR